MTPRMMIDSEHATIELPEQSPEESSHTSQERAKRECKGIKRHRLSRLVSQDQLASKVPKNKKSKIQDDEGAIDGSTLGGERSMRVESSASSSDVPQLPNPLSDSGILRTHIAAVRLEADLFPIRLLLSRLMVHSQNRKGIFNQPVDAEALGLADYRRIVTRPMDLGTIKRRLHAVAYQSRQEAIEDIRLVFRNAMLYNPPHHPVHISAKELLVYFDRCCQGIDPCLPGPSDLEARTAGGLVSGDAVASSSSSVTEETASAATTESRALTVPGPTGSSSTAECFSVATRNSCSMQDGTNASCPRSALAARRGIRMPKRRSSISQHGKSHACQQCKGRTCSICLQGCLQHEPALLVCFGSNCAGSRIRKGAVYYITKDGSHQFCDRCYPGLPSTLVHSVQNGALRYKQELLKRKNDEEIAEDWITCIECSGGVHLVCAMHNGFVHDESSYLCPGCKTSYSDKLDEGSEMEANEDTVYSFLSGSDDPVPLHTIKNSCSRVLDSDSLPECPVSMFIQEKVKNVMKHSANASKTITIRVISDCKREFSVPKAVRRYFRMASESNDVVTPPPSVQYRQKAIAMFQKIDGLDICVFCMYVQEYNGRADDPSDKRVYIAYIDSVEHFRPRELRTQVFHEILIAYLATARERGYRAAQIWACPPSRGNSFVFWNHPSSQRTPTTERLLAWYHGALSRAIDFGVVTDVKSLYESHFEEQLREISDSPAQVPSRPDAHLKERMICPPLIDGDFWIEEAVRIHHAEIAKHLKVRSQTEVCVWNVGQISDRNLDACPALQVASMLKDRVMTHPSSVPFRRPVNAAAMKLHNYHKIIKNPIDLGTIYSRCLLGEYHELKNVVDDVELMVSNAKTFNPPGHIVSSMATEILGLFYAELNALTNAWKRYSTDGEGVWESYADTSMSLDHLIEVDSVNASSTQPIVLVEDDRSSDGSRSHSSSDGLSSAPLKADNNEAISTDASTAEGKSLTKDNQLDSRKAKSTPSKVLNILTDGPEAVMQRLAGNDPKDTLSSRKPFKNSNKKRRRSSLDSDTVAEVSNRRRQSWLCEEVGLSIRRMRTCFFSCSLLPNDEMSETEHQKLQAYRSYVSVFRGDDEARDLRGFSLADTRSALLELSQFRNFEFDTLRRAKYSTAMLLYHIHHSNAPGTIPSCTSCGGTITEVRWHKVKKVSEISEAKGVPRPKTASGEGSDRQPTVREDLCASCYATRQYKDFFIPIPVSLSSQSM
eukprot:CAMPEP_0178824394 /NCGR_PEP_ID=MMETSP0746-20121128/5654_1 /TAXON_ID=913974 /ORGANISM="Nitzschia punctata, Strain CCMP561" /LENGTH=1230 /DNA_ID=CAMNT_0020486067 /DNA_START=76 /DNA_END=3768 /DNA_ORIENTATION=+